MTQVTPAAGRSGSPRVRRIVYLNGCRLVSLAHLFPAFPHGLSTGKSSIPIPVEPGSATSQPPRVSSYGTAHAKAIEKIRVLLK